MRLTLLPFKALKMSSSVASIELLKSEVIKLDGTALRRSGLITSSVMSDKIATKYMLSNCNQLRFSIDYNYACYVHPVHALYVTEFVKTKLMGINMEIYYLHAYTV